MARAALATILAQDGEIIAAAGPAAERVFALERAIAKFYMGAGRSAGQGAALQVLQRYTQHALGLLPHSGDAHPPGDVLGRRCADGKVAARLAERGIAPFGIATPPTSAGAVVYRSGDATRADVFDYIERFYNPRRRHSKLGYLSPMAFEARAMQT